jgi:alpha-ketoglutarate-dependent taurine dioxygenase
MTDPAFPLVINPPATGARGIAAVVDDLRGQLPALIEALRRHGALLLRGFAIRDASDFAQLVPLFPGQPIDYVGGAVPRTRINDVVFNSTELTRIAKIQLHNELAYQRDYPDLLLFYCQQPAARGGETIIADCRRILRDLDPALRDKFLRNGARYVRTFQDRRPLRERVKRVVILYHHLTWQAAFNAERREAAAEKCRARGMTYDWRPNGDLRVIDQLPAIVNHPVTGEPSWFNQVVIQHFNRRNYGGIVYGFRRLLYRDPSGLPNQVFFGDGSAISRDEIHHIMDITERHTVTFPWQAGDVLVLDNRLAAHGRNPYRGERKVYVAMLREAPDASTGGTA